MFSIKVGKIVAKHVVPIIDAERQSATYVAYVCNSYSKIMVHEGIGMTRARILCKRGPEICARAKFGFSLIIHDYITALPLLASR